MPAPTPQHIRDGMVALYLQGKSLADSAAAFGCTSKAAARAVQLAGLETRTPRGNPKQLARDVVADYSAGYPVPSLMTKYGLTRSGVRTMVVSAGVRYHSRSEGHRKHPLNEFAFSILTDDAAYWLGFILADGCVYSTDYGDPHNALRVGLASKDAGHLEKLKAFLGTSAPVKQRPDREYTIAGYHYPKGKLHASYLSVSSKTLVADLIGWGIVPRKSLIATPDRRLATLPAFWRGVVDGDGSVRWATNSPAISIVGTQHVCDAFATFVKQHYPASPIRAKRVRGQLWLAGCYGRAAIAMVHALYPSGAVSLDRKAEAAATLVDRHRPNGFDWSTVTRDMLIESFARLRSWDAVAAELGVSASSLKVRKVSVYGIATRNEDGAADVPFAASVRPAGVSVGDVRGWLEVLSPVEVGDKWKRRWWSCRCRCGNVVNRCSAQLNSPRFSSCGCGRIESHRI